jgi:hypothetical protein
METWHLRLNFRNMLPLFAHVAKGQREGSSKAARFVEVNATASCADGHDRSISRIALD